MFIGETILAYNLGMDKQNQCKHDPKNLHRYIQNTTSNADASWYASIKTSHRDLAILTVNKKIKQPEKKI